MNVLFLAGYPPVLNQHGGGSRMYHNIRILSEKHDVHVLSFVENDDEQDRVNDLRSMCASVKAIRRVPDFRPHWLSLVPFMVREFDTPAMHRAVDEAISGRQIDVIQCEYLQMGQFWRPGVGTILTLHEVLSHAGRIGLERDERFDRRVHRFYRWMQVLNYEVQMVRKFHRVVTMTEEDRAYLAGYARQPQITPIPIGVDTDHFGPARWDATAAPEVLFVGNYRHRPNQEAMDFIGRVVAPRFPNVRFTLAGSHMPPSLSFPGNVSCRGFVEDLRTLFHRPHLVFFAPLFSGSGQRVKLLEAFSAALPVVTTPLGAAGCPVVNGREAVVSNSEEALIESLDALLRSEDRRRALGERAREMVEGQFTWHTVGRLLLNVVDEAGGAARADRRKA